MPANHYIAVSNRRIELPLHGFIGTLAFCNILINEIGNICWHSASFQRPLAVEG